MPASTNHFPGCHEVVIVIFAITAIGWAGMFVERVDAPPQK
jgi:hypothetical protein